MMRATNPTFIITCDRMISSIPKLESKLSPRIGSSVMPIRNGGSKKGKTKTELMTPLALGPNVAK